MNTCLHCTHQASTVLAVMKQGCISRKGCLCKTPCTCGCCSFAPEALCQLAILQFMHLRLWHLQGGACRSLHSEDGVVPARSSGGGSSSSWHVSSRQSFSKYRKQWANSKGEEHTAEVLKQYEDKEPVCNSMQPHASSSNVCRCFGGCRPPAY
jgi:hypothetical protein